MSKRRIRCRKYRKLISVYSLAIKRAKKWNTGRKERWAKVGGIVWFGFFVFKSEINFMRSYANADDPVKRENLVI